MTITAYILCAAGTIGLLVFAFYLDSVTHTTREKVTLWVIVALTIVAIWCCSFLLFSTAAGQRAIADQQSNFGNGLDRTVTVYTADGNVLAQYIGRIDLDVNDGGYIKFDFEGKRYIYYNCFVESIANIGR